MKAEQRTVYVARDGRDFPTATQCRAHERKTSGEALVGLTAAQIQAAQSGADPELAETFRMFVNEMRNVQRRRPNGLEAIENNAGDKATAPLSEAAGHGRADDSRIGTDSERERAP
jgi:hypothetical protein